MSIDLTPIVEASARAAWETDAPGVSWDDAEPLHKHVFRERALMFVTPAALLIEQALRESIAEDIEAAKRDVDQSIATPGHYAGLGHAARITRGGAR